MKRKLSKKTQAAVALGAAAVVAVGGTFAWFSTTDQVKNVFDMDDFDVSITEAFDPETPMNPGSTITKQVGVTNYGDVPVYVRVKFEEKLVLKNWAFKENTNNRLLVYGVKTPTEAGDAETFLKNKDNFVTQDGSKYPYPDFHKAVVAVYDQNVIDTIEAVDSGWDIFTGANLEGVTVYRKDATADGDKNKVYQYFAYDDTDKQIVEIKAKTGEGGTTTYTAKYAYHVLKEPDKTYEATHKEKADEEWDNGIHYNDTDNSDTAGTEYITLNFANKGENEENEYDVTNWILDGEANPNEGWYYYKHILDPGASTENLLESVTFAKEMPNDYIGATYTITPVMEAVQANKDAVDATWDRVKDKTYEGEHGGDPYKYNYNVEVSEPTEPNAPVTWTIKNEKPRTV